MISYLLKKQFVRYALVIWGACIGLSSLAQPYPSNIPVNFIRIWDAVAPEADANLLMSRQLKDVKMATQYFDGLGRPLQSVIKQGSFETGGTATDFVNTSTYDQYGREQYQYLPFPANNTGGNTHINNGAFKLNPFDQQSTFMTAQYGGQGETFFYGKVNFETSPLSRIDKALPPGNSWVGSNRGVEFKYWQNTATDAVRIWNVTNNTGAFGGYTSTAVYNAGELFKTVTVDEHLKQAIDFKDKEGKIILKKIQLSTAPGTEDDGTGRGYIGWLCTYYIYDDMSRLRCVIQPRGVELISSNWVLTDATILAEQCFRYEYDQRGRMIKKKVPGAGEVWMVYDARDRLVMTQDANLRNLQKWMYTTYENDFNKPIITGLITDPSNHNNHDFHIAGATSSISYPNIAIYSYEELTRIFYDNYNWLSGYGSPLPSSYSSSYDTYFQSVSNTVWPYPQSNTQTLELKGAVTGLRIKILGTSSYLYSVNFYDSKGQIIQVQSTNITGGVDITTTQYTWAGQPLILVLKQEKQSTNAQTTVEVTQLTYDDRGRLVKTDKKISNTLVNSGIISSYKTIAEHEYDKLGQLKKKQLSPTYNNNTGLETLNYDYNIRGWMLGMNRDYAKDANNNNYFGFDLGYDKANNGIIGNLAYNNPQYNGNIEGMVWKSKGDGEKRKYDFTYDATNRITAADFNQYTSGTFNKTAGIDFSVSNLSYDANGNILAMDQKAWKVIGSGYIDQLTYNYYTNSNRLKNVVDNVNDVNTRYGDFRSSTIYMSSLGGTKTNSAIDYTYDANGNLRKDLNKDIGTAAAEDIVYNYLNLPQTITVRNNSGGVKGTITYTYDASGTKIKKEVNESGQPLKTTLYLGVVVYENDALQFVVHEEGRIRFVAANGLNPAKFEYDYTLKDHLGNVRMMLTEEIKNDQYPTLSFEGTGGSQEVINQDGYWENNNGQSINVTGVRTARPGAFGDATANGSYVRLIRKSTTSIGVTKFLKVMAGDRIHASVEYFYDEINTDNSTANPLNSFVNSLIGSFANTNTAGGLIKDQATTITGQLSGNSVFTGLLNTAPSASGSNQAPKAYMNILFFDDQFKFDPSSSVVVKVAYTPGVKGTLSRNFSNAITANKSGYVYVYFTNESDALVYFDNFMMTHERGRILEESHYYPFGLQMSGISSKALAFGKPENKEKTFQGQYFDDDLGLNWVQFKWRNHDPQIGKFVEVDPLSSKYAYNSTYAFSENKVTSHVELEGLESIGLIYLARAKKYYSRHGMNFTGSISSEGMINNRFIISNRIPRVENRKPTTTISGIVLHRTVSGNNEGTLGSFANSGNGTHFLVGKDGAIFQTASLNFGTYHYRPDLQINHFHLNRQNTISIEVVGFPLDKDGNIIKTQGTIVSWEDLTEAQAESVALLVNSLITTYGLTNNDIYNHEDIQKKGPGEGSFIQKAIRPLLNPANNAPESQNNSSQGGIQLQEPRDFLRGRPSFTPPPVPQTPCGCFGS